MNEILKSVDIQLILIAVFLGIALVYALVGLIRWVFQPIATEPEVEDEPENSERPSHVYLDFMISRGRYAEALTHVHLMREKAIEEGNREAVRVYSAYEHEINRLTANRLALVQSRGS